MIAVNTDTKHVIYSLGKTGTTSLTNTLSSDWHSTGEVSPDFLTTLYPDQFSGHVNQYDALKFLHSIGYSVTFIVRDPWKRYVSGIKEIVQDSLNIVSQDPIAEFFSNNNNKLTAHIDRLFYLSEFKRQNTFNFDVDFPYPSDFSLNYNYHIRNWLWEIENFDNCTIVDSKNLDDYIITLGLTPKPHLNTSSADVLKQVETCIKETNIYFYIERYLQSEIIRYQTISA